MYDNSIEWCNIQIAAINMAGAEFGSNILPGRSNINYFFLSERKVSYYRNAGFNTIRFPILWERLQPELNKPLDRYYLSGIKDALLIAAQNNMWLIIDLHNYGRFQKRMIGSSSVPIEAFADVWKRFATELANEPALLGYGLMNEPHGLGPNWPLAAQAATNAIRSVDTSRFVLVSGEHWSNANRFPSLHPKPFVRDIADRVVYEAHVYFDQNFSGIYKNGYDAKSDQIGVERVEPFLHWLTKHNQSGFIGEFSVPDNDPRWLLALDQFMQRLREHGPCAGWAYWAGGPWSPAYPMSLEPIAGQEKPQLTILKKYMKQSSL